MISIQIERVADILEEMKPLFPQHWDEVKQYTGVPFEPNYDIYIVAERIGMIALYTARSGRELVGYALFYVKPHSHSVSYKWGVMDMLWVDRRCRGRRVGLRLIRFWDADMKQRGVHTVHVEVPLSSPGLARLVMACGYAKVAEGFTKRLA